MEPFLSPRLRASENLDITLCMLQDIGWKLTTNADCLSAEFGKPRIHVSPNLLQFGEGGIGNIHLAETWINNAGDTLLSIEEVAADNALSTPFSIHTQSCAEAVLAPGNSCSITVEFQPDHRGEFDDGFDVRSNDPDTPVLHISVRGKGTTNNGRSGGGCVLSCVSGDDPLLALLVLLSVMWLLFNPRIQHRRGEPS